MKKNINASFTQTISQNYIKTSKNNDIYNIYKKSVKTIQNNDDITKKTIEYDNGVVTTTDEHNGKIINKIVKDNSNRKVVHKLKKQKTIKKKKIIKKKNI